MVFRIAGMMFADDCSPATDINDAAKYGTPMSRLTSWKKMVCDHVENMPNSIPSFTV
jgi:hypothetical protein